MVIGCQLPAAGCRLPATEALAPGPLFRLRERGWRAAPGVRAQFAGSRQPVADSPYLLA